MYWIVAGASPVIEVAEMVALVGAPLVTSPTVRLVSPSALLTETVPLIPCTLPPLPIRTVSRLLCP